MSQSNKICSVCGALGHSKFYCPKKVSKPLKRTAIKKTIKTTPKPRKIRLAGQQKTHKQLVKDLDTIFSRYIRLRDALLVDGELLAQCVTCGIRAPWKSLQNGHYISRGKFGTRWDEKNCHPQCMACNVMKHGNYPEYALFMIKTYGISILDILSMKASAGGKYSRVEMQLMIDDYTKKVAVLLQ